MMRKSAATCMAMPMMPMLMLARMMSRSARSCESRWTGADANACGDRSSRSKPRSRSGAEGERSTAARPRSVVDVARETGSFSSLLGALKAAGLDAALEAEGPFTVFAPNDEAFARVPSETLQGLLSDTAELKKVLQFHVVSGRLTSTDLAPVASLRTLDGRTLGVDLADGRVGGARVVQADLSCSNGVIHVVDSVLLPG